MKPKPVKGLDDRLNDIIPTAFIARLSPGFTPWGKNMTLVETMAIVDAFVSGCGKVEKLRHGNMRVTLFVDQSSDGDTDRIVVVKLVGARADMEQIAHAILRADDKPELADADTAGLPMQ